MPEEICQENTHDGGIAACAATTSITADLSAEEGGGNDVMENDLYLDYGDNPYSKPWIKKRERKKRQRLAASIKFPSIKKEKIPTNLCGGNINSMEKTDDRQPPQSTNVGKEIAPDSVVVKHGNGNYGLAKNGSFQFEIKPFHIIRGRNGKKMYKCEICMGTYRHSFSLKRHFIRNHVNLSYVNQSELIGGGGGNNSSSTIGGADSKCEKNDDKIKVESDKGGYFRCNFCQKIFNEINPLKVHLKDHPISKTDKNQYECDECDMKFGYKQNLIRHLQGHMIKLEKPYYCKYCCKQFSSKTTKRQHENDHETNRWPCEFCAANFMQVNDLKKHMKRLHSNDYVECYDCGKFFATYEWLKSHCNLVHKRQMIIELGGLKAAATTTTATGNKFNNNNNNNFYNNNNYYNYNNSRSSNSSSGGLLLDNIDKVFRTSDTAIDIADSMRLAKQSSVVVSYKFACTICRKRFHDYTQMCRHRRSVHQRHLVIATTTDHDDDKNVGKYNNIIKDKSQQQQYTTTNNTTAALRRVDRLNNGKRKVCDLDETESKPEFYSNISKRIDENLKRYIVGKADEIIEKRNIEEGKEVKESVVGGIKEENDKMDISFSFFNLPKHFTESKSLWVDISNRDAISTTTTTTTVHNTQDDKQEGEKGEIQDDSVLDLSLSTNSKLGSSSSSEQPLVFVEQQQQQQQQPSSSSTFQQFNPSSTSSPISGENQPPQAHAKPISSVNFNKRLLKSPPIAHNKKVEYFGMWSTPVVYSQNDSNSNSKYLTYSDFYDSSNNNHNNNNCNYKNNNNNNNNNNKLVKKKPIKKFVCLACNDSFPDINRLKEHQLDRHETIENAFLEMDEECEYNKSKIDCQQITECSNGSNSGSSSSNLDKVMKNCLIEKFKCTKCLQDFHLVSDLHKHIIECAFSKNTNKGGGDTSVNSCSGGNISCCSSSGAGGSNSTINKNNKEKEFRKYIRRKYFYKKGFAIRRSFSPKRLQVKKSGKKSSKKKGKNKNNSCYGNNNIKNKKRKVEEEEEIGVVKDNVNFGKRKKNSVKCTKQAHNLVIYEPKRHQRRRETVNIVDMHTCSGCGNYMGSITSLERHIPNCSQKERLRNVKVLENADDKQPTICKYCKKQFTYKRNLLNHIDLCNERRKFINKGVVDDLDWMEMFDERFLIELNDKNINSNGNCNMGGGGGCSSSSVNNTVKNKSNKGNKNKNYNNKAAVRCSGRLVKKKNACV